MRWSWSMRPQGAARLLTPVITWTGRRQEQAMGADMKLHLETRNLGHDGGRPLRRVNS